MTDETDPEGDAHRRPEVVIARFRPHARRLFWPCVLVVVVAVGAGFGIGVFQGPLAWCNVAVALVALVLVVVGGLVPFVRWLGERYVLTSRRLVLVRGLAVRTRRELLHSRGHDVTVRRAGLQTLFRSGDVILDAGLERPVVLVDVPSADLVLTVLHDLMESNAPDRPRRYDEPQAGVEPSRWVEPSAADEPQAGVEPSGWVEPRGGTPSASFWIDRD